MSWVQIPPYFFFRISASFTCPIMKDTIKKEMFEMKKIKQNIKQNGTGVSEETAKALDSLVVINRVVLVTVVIGVVVKYIKDKI